MNWACLKLHGLLIGTLPFMKFILSLRMKEKKDQVVNRIPQETKGTHTIEKGHQDLRGNQIHSPLEAMVHEEVPELQEEEEKEMNPVIPVGTKDQIRVKVQILKKKMRVVSLPLD